MVSGPDLIDDCNEVLIPAEIWTDQSELRTDKHERDPRGARGRDAALYGRAEQRLVNADDGVVGADLPDHQPRPAGLQGAFEA